MRPSFDTLSPCDLGSVTGYVSPEPPEADVHTGLNEQGLCQGNICERKQGEWGRLEELSDHGANLTPSDR